MKKCRLSLIIPVYNVERYLEKCLDSIYCQITDECEVILVDDGSPDSCGAICDSYGAKYREYTTVIHQENTGNGGARNAGIEASCGDYLFFIDSDDTLEKDAVETLLSLADETDADVILFASRSVTENGDVLSYSNEPFVSGKLLRVKEYKNVLTAPPGPCTRITKAALYKDYGIRFPHRVWYEDIRTTVKTLGVAETVYYTDKVLYNYLRRSGSIMNNGKVERNGEIIWAMDDLIEFFTEMKLYDTFRDELDFLVIDHVLVAATVRVLRCTSPRHPLVKELRDYTYSHCKSVKDNPYSATMTGTRRLIFRFLQKKLYLPVVLIFRYIKK